jgi:hypothetical protein
MSQSEVVKGILEILREAFEGGRPGEGTGFVETTKKDGSRNSGVFATLEGLTAAQASQPTALGTSVASHAAHVAYHLEVTVRWMKGDRGPFDWAGSFEPGAVDNAAWAAMRTRVRAAYDGLAAKAALTTEWDEDAAGSIAASVAHAAYHLGAIRQIAKLAR